MYNHQLDRISARLVESKNWGLGVDRQRLALLVVGVLVIFSLNAVARVSLIGTVTYLAVWITLYALATIVTYFGRKRYL